jgi:hypothetical protein
MMAELFWGEISIPVSGRYAPIHQEITACNKASVGSHQSFVLVI